jgi:hypothetical protein
MNETYSPKTSAREATSSPGDGAYLGRIMAFGSVILWLVTLLILVGSSGVRGF